MAVRISRLKLNFSKIFQLFNSIIMTSEFRLIMINLPWRSYMQIIYGRTGLFSSYFLHTFVSDFPKSSSRISPARVPR